MAFSAFHDQEWEVSSPHVHYTDDAIIAKYDYQTTRVEGNRVTPITESLEFRTERR
jgi:hypothetical protein